MATQTEHYDAPVPEVTGPAATPQPAPYRFWAAQAPFTKHGTPVIGSFGKTIRQVVIFDAETFKRLLREVPALATVQFEMGEL